MKRLPIWIVAVLAVVACNKPSESDCRKAIANMQRLMGTESLHDAAQIEGEVRSCKGGSKKKSVQCAIDAKTLADLQHCDFYHVPPNAKGVGPIEPTGSAGSAAGSAGSASGSDAGSGSAGAAMGGAGATGSAGAAMGGAGATGSAAAGSAGSAK